MDSGTGRALEDQYQNEHNLRQRVERVHADVLRIGAEVGRIAKLADRVEKMQGEMNYLLGTHDGRIPGVIPELTVEGGKNSDFRKQATAVLAALILLVGWLISLNYLPTKGDPQVVRREAIERPK